MKERDCPEKTGDRISPDAFGAVMRPIPPLVHFFGYFWRNIGFYNVYKKLK